MKLYPAIDLYEGSAVRLYKGDYDKMTVYSTEPWRVALDFRRARAERIHIVDLEGARDGTTPNFACVLKIKRESGLFCEIGGGVRSMDTVEKYLSAGIDRVILGTAALEDEKFLKRAVKEYGERIAVGADLKYGYVAVRGWREVSNVKADEFFGRMEKAGVRTVICTDISKDGALGGTNRALYEELNRKYAIDIVASGGVSTIDDVTALSEMGLAGAIIGKAYYTGAIDLAEAVRCADDN
ncbi:MAG: 1-(5-phosphoribosyl)-5-[Clostridia bacterium]|nr:1-(5-phosphoribosyl)-5-[(5-phosphoribosylamino)methylideneamino]imidazole-4-carboxamide isomerase [Clostridia bacterium]